MRHNITCYVEVTVLNVDAVLNVVTRWGCGHVARVMEVMASSRVRPSRVCAPLGCEDAP